MYLNHPLFVLSVFYFCLRLVNITILPIFNDEAIYLDWAWRELHEPGLLFYSLYDAKQPLLMWVFGISEMIFYDPLFAGRLVSVVVGFAAATGLYKVGSKLFDKKTGVISFILYSIIPIFSFYDRQALMESSIGAVGIWSFFFFIEALQSEKKKYFVYLGLVLGIGFFIKSTAFIFFLSSAISLFYLSTKNKKIKVNNLLIMIISFLAIDFILLIQPLFWKTLPTNNRYSFGLSDLLRFPIWFWVTNIIKNFEILFIFFTPLMFIALIYGLVLLKKKQSLLIFFIFSGILLEILLVRNANVRYLVSFLPLLTLFPAYAIVTLMQRYNEWVVGFILFSIPLSFTILQTFIPVKYFDILDLLSRDLGRVEYVSSGTSGFATNQAIKALEDKTKSGRLGVGIGLNTGNPESAVIVYFNKNSNTRVFYIDTRMKSVPFEKYDCFETNIPVYFVSRNRELVGLDKYFVLEKEFRNPYGEGSVSIYYAKTCTGKRFKLNI